MINSLYQLPSSGNGTYETMYSYNVTSLRRDDSYITIYVNWFLLITTGLLPMGALVFLNG